MSRYSKRHYEDVAGLLNKQPIASVGSLRQAVKRMVDDFADLFAADNPDYCGHCGTAKKDIEGPNCDDRLQPLEGHSYVKGFNREQFLAACGLEPVVKGDS